MTIRILVGLIPPAQISENIKLLRSYFTRVTGKNLYGNNEPHVTIWLNSYSLTYEEVRDLIFEVLARMNKFTVKFDGIEVYDDGKVVKTKTIVYKIKKNRTLSKIQRGLVDSLNKFRTRDQENFCRKANPYLTSISENVEKYGYWFGPDDWKFHASIGTVSYFDYDKVSEEVNKFNLALNQEFKEIGMFVYYHDKGWVLSERIKLQD